MLFKPTWNKEYSVASVKGWLETQDPEARYNWQTEWGICGIGEWRIAMGESARGKALTDEIGRRMGTSPEHTKIVMIFANSPWTYGAALERARLALQPPDALNWEERRLLLPS